MRNLVFIAILGAPAIGLADHAPHPPTIRNYADGQTIELEAEAELDLMHPDFGNDSPTSECTFSQGTHTVRVQGGRQCKFAVGALAKAKFAPGPAKLQVQTTINGAKSALATIQLTLVHEGGFWGSGGGGGVIREGCNRLRTVSLIKSQLSFLFTVIDPTAYDTDRAEVIDLGRLAIPIKSDGTFHETIQLPVLAVADPGIHGDKLAAADNHFGSGMIDNFKGFLAKRTLIVSGNVSPDLKKPARIDFTMTSPGDPSSNCEFQFLRNGTSRPYGGIIQRGQAGDSCSRDNDCDRFCKSGQCN